MKFIDTHIHLQDFKSAFATDIINSSLKNGVDKLVCASIKTTDWPIIAKLYDDFPNNIIPAFGVHPWEAKNLTNGWEKELEGFIKKYPNALIGEAGLDRHRVEDFEPQNSVFKTHIELAKKYHRPLLVHAVKCQDWLENYWNIMPEKFVMHSYNGRRELMKKALSHGGYISYSSSILNNREKEKTLGATPLDRLLLETDAPYQGAMEDISKTAAEIAKIRDIDIETFTKQVYQNSTKFIETSHG